MTNSSQIHKIVRERTTGITPVVAGCLVATLGIPSSQSAQQTGDFDHQSASPLRDVSGPTLPRPEEGGTQQTQRESEYLPLPSGLGLSTAKTLERMHHPDSSSSKSQESGFSWGTLWNGFATFIVAVSLVNLLRGMAKAPDDFSTFFRKRKNREHFEAGHDLSSPSINVHSFEEIFGDSPNSETKHRLTDVLTIKKPKLHNVFGNSEALKVFRRAAEKCDENNGLLSLNFGDAACPKSSEFLRKFLFDPIRAASSFVRGKPFVHETTAERSKRLQLRYLKEMNKLFRDSCSELHKDGILTNDGKAALVANAIDSLKAFLPIRLEDEAMFKRVPLVIGSVRRVIWICEIEKGISRDLICVDIADEHFDLFGDEKKVAELLKNSPSHARRINQLRQAYLAEQDYRRSIKEGDEPYLFPQVKVYTDVSDKAVNLFNVLMTTKYRTTGLNTQIQPEHVSMIASEQSVAVK